MIDSGLGESQILSDSYSRIFNQVIKNYEKRSFKKAIKLADEILAKYPDHGETLSMKAICLYSLSSAAEESISLAKKGTRCNVKSPCCWHILGILYINTKQLSLATRCYEQALKNGDTRVDIMNYLSRLQLYFRDIKKYLQTRNMIFLKYPNSIFHLLMYAFAQHLNGYRHLAIKLCDTFLKFYSPSDSSGDMICLDSYKKQLQTQEIYFYMSSLYEESGLHDKAYDQLKKLDECSDIITKNEMLGRLCLYTNKKDEAYSCYTELHKLIPNSKQYIILMLSCSMEFRNHAILHTPEFSRDNLSRTSSSSLSEFLIISPYTLNSPLLTSSGIKGWQTHPPFILYQNNIDTISKHSRLDDLLYNILRPLDTFEEEIFSKWIITTFFKNLPSLDKDTVIRIALNFVQDQNRFLFYSDLLLRNKILKGAHFCANIIKGLHSNSYKFSLLLSLFEKYYAFFFKYEKSMRLSSILSSLYTSPLEISCYPEILNHFIDQQPTYTYDDKNSRISVLSSLSILYIWENKFYEALQYINEALLECPNSVELIQIKAQIYYQMGCVSKACELIYHIREIDKSDRFLHTVYIKYLLMNDKPDQVSIFLKTIDPYLPYPKACQISLEFPTFKDKNCLLTSENMWFINKVGDAYLNQNCEPLAMKYYYDTINFFSGFRESEHAISIQTLKSYNIRVYLQLLQMQNRLESQKFFRHAAKKIIHILINQNQLYKNHTHYINYLNIKDETVIKSKISDRKNLDTHTSFDINYNEIMKIGLELLEKDQTDINTEVLRLGLLLSKNASLCSSTHCVVYKIASKQNRILLMLQSLYRLWLLGNKSIEYHKFYPILLDYVQYAYKSQLLWDSSYSEDFSLLQKKDQHSHYDIIKLCSYNVMNEFFSSSNYKNVILNGPGSMCYENLKKIYFDIYSNNICFKHLIAIIRSLKSDLNSLYFFDKNYIIPNINTLINSTKLSWVKSMKLYKEFEQSSVSLSLKTIITLMYPENNYFDL